MPRLAHLFALLSALLCWGSPAAAQAPDTSALRDAAAATKARLEKDAARWTVVYLTRGGARIEVQVVHTPFAVRRLLRLQLGERAPREVLRVIEREGACYVSEVGGVRGIYRPREAPFLFPSAYVYLDGGRLPLAQDLRALGSFHGRVEQGRWRFRKALAPTQERSLERLVASLERLVQRKPSPQVKVRLIQAKEALAQGVLSDVDPKTGLLYRFGPPDARAQLASFQWLDEIDLADFVTEGEALPDRRAPLTAPLAQLAHCGIWQPGAPRADVDLRLVSLATGEVRRPPVALPRALPGCFLGEDSLLVTAPHPGGVGLFRVELKSGETERLGGRALSKGAVLLPTLSPDRKTVALLHVRDATSGKAQPTLLDLADPGRVRLVGTPVVSGTTLSWFPQGDALLFVRRAAFLPDAPPYAAVTRLSLAGGAMRELCRGESPVFVGERILYRDKGGLWRTCDAEGKDRRPLGEGLKGCEAPAPGPKGERVLMIQRREQGPRPVLVELKSGRVTPLPLKKPLSGGLWGLPVWR